jgi:predicted glutamine amidotransferase
VIASRPLTDGEDWTDCHPGRLLVIERGSAVFGA